MRLADADGKVRLLIVNRSQWRVGFKRELTIETVRDAQKRQNVMVVSFRIALQDEAAPVRQLGHPHGPAVQHHRCLAARLRDRLAVSVSRDYPATTVLAGCG